jgi:hypothetical protein
LRVNQFRFDRGYLSFCTRPGGGCAVSDIEGETFLASVGSAL